VQPRASFHLTSLANGGSTHAAFAPDDQRRRRSPKRPARRTPVAWGAVECPKALKRCYLPFFFDFIFCARRASRNFLISDFGKSLCLEHTIPNTGAARFEQPGTGQS
jgi:hypothetical protein